MSISYLVRGYKMSRFREIRARLEDRLSDVKTIHLILFSVKRYTVGKIFRPISQQVVHHVQLLLESNPEWIVLKTDVKNAFNSLDRTQLLQEVSSSFPDIFHHIKQMYLNVNSFVFLKKTKPVDLNSEQGIHQGDPLGPALFSTAIHPILLNIQNKNPKMRVVAYLDDVFLLGPQLKFFLSWKISEQLSSQYTLK